MLQGLSNESFADEVQRVIAKAQLGGADEQRAFVVDVERVSAAVEAAGYPVVWADPAEIPGRFRFHTFDTVGNRVEFLAQAL